MKIGIMTYHRAYNCGAMLQAWALKTVLHKMGYDVVFPICNHVGEAQRWLRFERNGRCGLKLVKGFLGWLVVNLLSIGAEGLSQSRYKAFRKKNLPELNIDVERLGEKLDLLVFGSDQIWRPELMSVNEQRVFFAESISEKLPKIAYAASYDDKPLEGVSAKRLARTVRRFAKVSVREQLLLDQIKEETGVKVPIVLDPTLLLKRCDYDNIMSSAHPDGEYLFVYTLYTTPYVMAMAKFVSDKLNIKLIVAPVYKFSRYGAPKGLTYGMSPDRLISYVAHAKYVMSYSFHGTVFSIIYGKPFLDLRNEVDEFETRSGCLLRRIGLSERAVNPSISPEESVVRLCKPLGHQYHDKLNELRSDSLNWLSRAIASTGLERT